LTVIGIQVDCYAGYRSDERPRTFILGGKTHQVLDIEDRWYSPGAAFFRVRSDDGHLYILRHDETLEIWTLEAFRACC
jgi:hypothetical protein